MTTHILESVYLELSRLEAAIEKNEILMTHGDKTHLLEPVLTAKAAVLSELCEPGPIGTFSEIQVQMLRLSKLPNLSTEPSVSAADSKNGTD
jgi:hypothetical protein